MYRPNSLILSLIFVFFSRTDLTRFALRTTLSYSGEGNALYGNELSFMVHCRS